MEHVHNMGLGTAKRGSWGSQIPREGWQGVHMRNGQGKEGKPEGTAGQLEQLTLQR